MDLVRTATGWRCVWRR
ncbi:hypothetical protein F383_35135 [Gossypium arboreum]|uniref:Uncharacterized protein n=1 Tax=Gossypium arboreum TaxID=29729 RepID=A0A0B0N5E3_GOSAR|nr:hypothetical protein F383_35135 [Gossypium arboreum]